MNGLIGGDAADQVATWVAAIATIIVLGGLVGERRLFAWSQHLLAGLGTGFLALLAIDEVIVPRLLSPLVADPAGQAGLWVGLALVALAASALWLPRVLGAVPVSIAVGALAAFALGGAVVGTILPQLAAAVARPDAGPGATLASVGGAAISALVLVGFIHGGQRGRLVEGAGAIGRWLLLAGIGGWLGYLILSRLLLLVDRIAFLIGDWLGIGR